MIYYQNIPLMEGEKEKGKGSGVWPSMVTHTRNLSSAFNPSKCTLTAVNTHTRSSGQPYCGARGAVGGSVPCSRVSPQSWYWRWREHLLFTPPSDNPCRTWESNLQPLGYKSNSLTIRPRLPHMEVTELTELTKTWICSLFNYHIHWINQLLY